MEMKEIIKLLKEYDPNKAKVIMKCPNGVVIKEYNGRLYAEYLQEWTRTPSGFRFTIMPGFEIEDETNDPREAIRIRANDAVMNTMVYADIYHEAIRVEASIGKNKVRALYIILVKSLR